MFGYLKLHRHKHVWWMLRLRPQHVKRARDTSCVHFMPRRKWMPVCIHLLQLGGNCYRILHCVDMGVDTWLFPPQATCQDTSHVRILQWQIKHVGYLVADFGVEDTSAVIKKRYPRNNKSYYYHQIFCELIICNFLFATM